MVKALDIKGMHVDRVEYVTDEAFMYGEPYRHDHIDIHARPYKRIRQTCPVCGEKCPLYDHKAFAEVAWIHEGYGQEIFKLFCESLTEKEWDQIEGKRLESEF